MKRMMIRLNVGLLLLACGLPAFGQSAPILLNFQGRLTNSVGAPLTGATSIQLTLLRGGTASEAVSIGTIVYQETASVTPDGNGVFTHVIGTGMPVGGQTLVAEDFDTSGVDLFIEMSIGAEVLLPRTQVLSVPYAIEAARLGGLTAQTIIGTAGGNAFVNETVRVGGLLEWVSAAQVRIAPGTLGFSDGLVRKNTTDLLFDFANGVGLLGLDAGSETIATWYYMYVVPDPVDDTQFSAIVSVAPPPTGPSGFAVWRYMGAFRNSDSSNIKRFYEISRGRFQYASRQTQESVSGPTAVSSGPDLRDLSGFVPATASAVVLIENHHGQDADWHAFVDGGGTPVTPSLAWNRSGSGSTGMWSDGGEYLIPTPGSPKGYWRQWRVATWRNVYVTGWVDSYLD